MLGFGKPYSICEYKSQILRFIRCVELRDLREVYAQGEGLPNISGGAPCLCARAERGGAVVAGARRSRDPFVRWLVDARRGVFHLPPSTFAPWGASQILMHSLLGSLDGAADDLAAHRHLLGRRPSSSGQAQPGRLCRAEHARPPSSTEGIGRVVLLSSPCCGSHAGDASARPAPARRARPRCCRWLTRPLPTMPPATDRRGRRQPPGRHGAHHCPAWRKPTAAW